MRRRRRFVLPVGSEDLTGVKLVGVGLGLGIV
jgi:hypothetical protein